MAKTSIKAAVRDAVREQSKLTPVRLLPDGSATKAATADSFNNFAHKLGIGADNALSTATYGFNPISRNRVMLEWMHRGSWLAGVAVDAVADDMTRAGVDYTSEMEPGDIENLNHAATAMGLWKKTNECIKWSRLYGGAICVMLIDGQSMRTPLREETIGPGQFKGLLTLDRWMVQAELGDLVTDLGPDLGKPKFYTVGSNAPALRGQVIHHSRLAYRLVGVELPYQQALGENLWGCSVIERLYDRMVAYDSASTGAAQLVYKCYLRTLKIKGMREVVSMGGPAMDGLVRYTDMMTRYQSLEGLSLIDGEDELEVQEHGAFSGLNDALTQFAQQLSGALQIPLTRLFGQSPAGFSDGDNDVRNYYDHIKQRQESDLGMGVLRTLKMLAASEEINIPKNFSVTFKSLWQLTETDQSTIAKDDTATILTALDAAIISPQVALQELRQSSRKTGIWTNITSQLIKEADEELPDPLEGAVDPETGLPLGGPPGAGGGPPKPPGGGNRPRVSAKTPAKKAGAQKNGNAEGSQGKARPQGSQSKVAPGSQRRTALRKPTPPSSKKG